MRKELYVIFALALPMICTAQDANLNLFLFEKSSAALIGSPNILGAPAYYIQEADHLAEAQLVSHFAFRRGLDAQKFFEGDSNGWKWNLFLTAQFRLRAFDEASLPIRSMSYLPRFTLQFLDARAFESDGPLRAIKGRRRILGINLVTGHHSNGGEGCVFFDEQIDTAGSCISTLSPSIPSNQRVIHTEGGNFSTNYIELGVFRRWGYVDDTPKQHWVWSLDAGLSLQINHNVGFPIPGGAVKAFRDLYGPLRPRLDIEFKHMIFKKNAVARFWLSAEKFWPKYDRYPGSKNYRMEAEFLVQRAGANDKWWNQLWNLVGVGFRYARGQDYYNMQFVRDIELLQFIFVIDPWSPWR